MQEQFNTFGQKSKFLKKKKEQKELLQKKQKQLKSSIRIQSAFRKNRDKLLFFKPFLVDVTEKLQKLLLLKKHTDPEKFGKTMANAVYKMPFFFQILIFLNLRNYKNYQSYILKIIQTIIDKSGKCRVVRKIINTKGFQWYELIKLVKFAILLHPQNPICEDLVKQYFQITIEAESTEDFKYLVNQKVINQKIQQFLASASTLKPIMFQHMYLKHSNKFNLSESHRCRILLSNLTATPQAILLLRQIKDIRAYIEPMKLQQIQLLLHSSRIWVQEIIEKYSQNFNLINTALELHYIILMILHQKYRDIITKKYGGKHMQIEQDEEYQQYEELRIRKSVDYFNFQSKIQLSFYMTTLLNIFKTLSQEIIVFKPNLEIAQYLRHICRIYIRIDEIFDETYKTDLTQLYSDQIIQILYRMTRQYLIFDLNKQKNTLKLLSVQLLVICLRNRLSEMDDVQFVKSSTHTLSSSHLNQVVILLKDLIINIISTNNKINNRLLSMSIELINDLYSKCFRTKLLPIKIFQNQSLTDELELYEFNKKKDYLEVLLTKVPFFFSFETRFKKFRQLIKIDKKNYDRALYHDQDYDNQHTITIRRGNQFNDAYHACIKKELRHKYKIVFINQQGHEQPGIDGGGIIKQFLNRVIKLAFNPQYGLFKETAQREMIPNPYAYLQQLPNQLDKEYEFVGLLVGKAIYENIQIQPKFAGPFLNNAIGRKNTLEDLRYIDKDMYQSLLSLKNSKEDISNYEFTFSVTESINPTTRKQFELKQGGSKIAVKNDNKLQFIMALTEFKANKQLQKQTKMFRRGFVKIIKESWLKMFNHQELRLMISGKEADFDIKDLYNNCVYNNYTDKDVTIKHFWQIVKEMTPQYKSLLLLFVTSCSRPPTLGFQSLKPKFCIARSQLIQNLPSAHTCMNILKIPDYKDINVLQQKLFYAITAKAGFEMQ